MATVLSDVAFFSLIVVLAGLFLGTLVVVGQGSKEGTMQVRQASSRSFGGCFDVFR